VGYPVPRSNTDIPLTFTLVLSADHITGATGKTPTVTISKNGAAFVTPAGAVSEIGAGSYQVAPNAFDTNTLGPILLNATATGCDPTDETFIVVNYNPTAFTPTSSGSGPTAITALTLINEAYEILGVKNPNQSLPANLAQGALRRLNWIIEQWSIMSLTIPVVARETFSMTVGKGDPSDPYTIGPGGDLDTSRPNEIDGAATLVSSAPNPFEIPMGLLTDDAYQSLVVKSMPSTFATSLYYNATFSTGLGQIYLYPVPSQANTLVLYRLQQLGTFANLSTSYGLPPAAASALIYELAKKSARPMGRPWTPDMQQDADQALAIYQRGNTKMVDLGMDAALTSNGGGLYNILSDGYSGRFGR
jgi:hypothetical protein